MVIPMKKTLTPRLLLTLVLLTAAAAAVHLACASETVPGALVLEADGKETAFSPDTLPIIPVEGEIVNGRDEVRTVREEGWALGDVLKAAGFDPAGLASVTVLAADGYSAAVTGGELREEGRVYLLRREGPSFRLIVFGDPDSRRSVKDVVRLIPEKAAEAAVPAA